MSRVTAAARGSRPVERTGSALDAAAPQDGRSRRWDSHRAERRRALAHAARKAVHHEGPDLSMDELATAMQTSKSIVYRYFTDKAGLQGAVGELVLEEMSEAFDAAAHTEGDPHARLRAMVGVYATMIDHSPHVYRFVTRVADGADLAGLSAFQATISGYVEIPLREALDAAGADTGLAAGWAAGAVGFVRGVGDVWLGSEPGNHPSAETMADLVTDWLWHGIGAATSISPTERT
ncbi:TetR/AcrR family transcriptional regulator [Ruania halotolerans]|uniref:TetR/AcrR family transcriptional regulator n=1 Tax=Ruania halotolerans TaxID=2897773 RepID=UPI001E36D602|nr:TetR/AcrR family transcriptional regulator [Ruania halotolerans]UFU06018.1 TetR/AcrR family transcriptional regulator [Ruania halotolerans]